MYELLREDRRLFILIQCYQFRALIRDSVLKLEIEEFIREEFYIELSIISSTRLYIISVKVTELKRGSCVLILEFGEEDILLKCL